MAVAHADLKPETPVEFGLRGQVVGRNDEMIDGAGHAEIQISSDFCEHMK
jgi:hypothetical protein